MDETPADTQKGPKQFSDEVKLFACNLISGKTLSFDQFRRLLDLAPSGCDLLDFGQLIIDHEIVEDGLRIQEVLDKTCDELDAGRAAPFDPFPVAPEAPKTNDEAESRAPLRLAKAPTESTQKTIAEPPTEASKSHGPSREHSTVSQGTTSPDRPKIPLPKKPVVSHVSPKESAAKPEASSPRDPVDNGPKKPIKLGSSPAPQKVGDSSSLDDLVARAVEEVKANPPAEMATPDAATKRPIRQPKTSQRVSVDTNDLQALAAAAAASIKAQGAGLGQAAPMPEAAPLSAQSKAEKPSESIIPVKGQSAQIPDFEHVSDLDKTSAREVMISLLLHCAENGYSDLHISAAARPFARKHGEVEYFGKTVLDERLAEVLNQSLLSPKQLKYFKKQQDYDFAIPFDSGHRFRTNFMVHKDGIAGTYRIVPDAPKPINTLGFTSERSELIKKLLAYHNGLILVTGPVGSGKTTTLASLVYEMNHSRSDHIICVEEPIEIVHYSEQCSVTQRGVGPHTNTFHSALKGALRQDPDIIVIGEMRDLETIEMAISASETGHLVIGTMHTSDASNTLNRLLDVFPPAQQPQIRAMVAESLKGVVCQRLLPSVSGGVVMACEILLNNSAVASLIREGKSQGLSNVMETGKREGMILMDNSIQELYRAGEISEQTARENIKNEMILRQLFAPPEVDDEAPTPAPKKKGGFFGKN